MYNLRPNTNKQPLTSHHFVNFLGLETRNDYIKKWEGMKEMPRNKRGELLNEEINRIAKLFDDGEEAVQITPVILETGKKLSANRALDRLNDWLDTSYPTDPAKSEAPKRAGPYSCTSKDVDTIVKLAFPNNPGLQAWGRKQFFNGKGKNSTWHNNRNTTVKAKLKAGTDAQNKQYNMAAAKAEEREASGGGALANFDGISKATFELIIDTLIRIRDEGEKFDASTIPKEVLTYFPMGDPKRSERAALRDYRAVMEFAMKHLEGGWSGVQPSKLKDWTPDKVEVDVDTFMAETYPEDHGTDGYNDEADLRKCSANHLLNTYTQTKDGLYKGHFASLPVFLENQDKDDSRKVYWIAFSVVRSCVLYYQYYDMLTISNN